MGTALHSGRNTDRLLNYDYTQPGAYLLTIRVHTMQCRLGKIRSGHHVASVEGDIADRFWTQTQGHFKHISIDAYIIMPNHLHAITVIAETSSCRGGVTPPLRDRESLGDVVAYYKYQTTKAINLIAGTSGSRFWQRDYYDHVIRDENDHARHWQCIHDNVLRWELDCYYGRG